MEVNGGARGTVRWYVPVLVIFALALGMRLTFLNDIRHIGFFERPVSDGYVYDVRAREIAAGDWLGPPSFVHAPLYAYVLGTIKICGGTDPFTPRIFQMLCGAGTCVLLLATGRRLFGLPIAALAGLLLAAYPPAIFFDGLIQKTSLALLLSTIVLWLLVLSTTKPTWWRWGLAGVALGLLILTRQNALLLIPLLLAWLWLGLRQHAYRRRAAWTLATLLGLTLTLLPWVMRNRAVTGEFVLTTPNLGQNFAMGNHPDATGTYLPFKRSRATAE
ncbi:MAG: glycosyltransferase family 39 protein, partial [Planctomycetota bacterium]